jgi:hypothetical protein
MQVFLHICGTIESSSLALSTYQGLLLGLLEKERHHRLPQVSQRIMVLMRVFMCMFVP